MKLFKFLKKDELSEDDKLLNKELKKLPRRRRKKAYNLYQLAKKGFYIRVGQDIDIKKLLKPGEDWYNGQVSR